MLVGTRQVSLTREQLEALPQYTAVLPIACVEGWSVSGTWTGVRLADRARLAMISDPGSAHVESLERHGSFKAASLSAAQVTDPHSMLALLRNGADLSWDHGYPARTIVSAAPGVHNTKWVTNHLHGTSMTPPDAPSGRIRQISPGGLARRIWRWYGANPLHLLTLLAAFALAGYALHAVIDARQRPGFALWFAVAIVGHDLLLLPLYSVADLSTRRLLPRLVPRRLAGPRAADGSPSSTGGSPGGPPGLARPPVINYLRVPIAFSLLLLLVWFPLILRLSAVAYFRASGLSTSPNIWRWLAVTGVLFAGSAAAYAVALRRAAGRARRAARPDPA